MADITKKLEKAYEKHSVTVSADRIHSACGISVKPLLKDGNSKTGKKVKTFSTLAGKKEYKTAYGNVCGTCPINCDGCYGMCGCYNFSNVKDTLAANTILCEKDLEFVNNAIRAQLDTLPGVDIRIHATGDFMNDNYAAMWHDIARDYKNNHFWTYTKVKKYETLFDDLENANIVKSIIDGIGFNFGHIEYILRVYLELVARGERPYICRCTFDPDQHCENCRGCIENKYVLFAEHSTDYVAADDPLFPAACEIVNAQKDHTHAEICEMIRAALNIK